MDHSITLVTPAMQRERGAAAFDEGRGIDDHYMNPGAPGIADWQAGWCARERQVQEDHAWAAHALARALAGACPP